MKNSYVYIVTNWTGDVMYVGITNNLEKRIAEHRSGVVSDFTKRYKCQKLVHFEHFGDIEMAIMREKEIKGWRREKKNALVFKNNPDRDDLSSGWYEDPSAARSG